VTLNLPRDQLPGTKSMDDSKDLSPDIKKLMKDMQKNMGAPKANQQGLGITKQPASGGGMGEDKAGGAGPSSPRADPLSDKAPQCEGDDKRARSQLRSRGDPSCDRSPLSCPRLLRPPAPSHDETTPH